MIAPLGNIRIEILDENDHLIFGKDTALVTGQANFFLPAGNYKFRIADAPYLVFDKASLSGQFGNILLERVNGEHFPLPVAVTANQSQGIVLWVTPAP